MQNEIKIPKFIFDNLLGSVVHVIVYIQILTLNRKNAYTHKHNHRFLKTFLKRAVYSNINIKFIIVFTYLMIWFFGGFFKQQ